MISFSIVACLSAVAFASCSVICLLLYLYCKVKLIRKKEHGSDENIVHYDATNEEARIVQPSPETVLRRHAMIERLREGIERNVEEIGAENMDRDSLFDFIA